VTSYAEKPVDSQASTFGEPKLTENTPTDGIFKLLPPSKKLEFTGERMTRTIEGQIEFEHFHRYSMARDLCGGLDVVDVASGEGYGSAILASVAKSVIGVDIDQASVDHARQCYRSPNLQFLHGNALELPLDNAAFDIVVSFETLEHLRDQIGFMREVRRVLRPTGCFIVSTPDRIVYSAAGENFNEFHLLELSKTEFEALLRSNFSKIATFRQRAILGSLIAGANGSAAGWRSYERRHPEYVEAASGLSRAPYLIGIATDAELPHVASSAYIDRRTAGEAAAALVRAPAAEAHAAQVERERDELRRRLEEASARVAVLERDLDEFAKLKLELKLELDEAWNGLAEARAQAAAIEQDRVDARNAAQRERDNTRNAVARLEHERDAARYQLAEAARRDRDQQWDNIRQLAKLRRKDYDGRLPNKLTGFRWLLPWRRKSLREMANEYRIIASSPLFDRDWYLSNNPDIATKFIDPVLHYLRTGAREARAPGPQFDGALYLKANPDVADAQLNPLIHYVKSGHEENRSFSIDDQQKGVVPDLTASSRSMETLQREFRNKAREKLFSLLNSAQTIGFETSEDPLISIVLVLYNSAELTLEHLRSLQLAVVPRCEIVIVDNASTDETHSLLSRVSGVKKIFNESNVNYLRAVNQGAAVAGGRYILLLNNDTRLQRDAIRNALSVLISDPSIGAVGGKLILLDGTLQEAGSIIWGDGSCVGYGRGQNPTDPEFEYQRDVDYCSAAFIMFPRQLFENLGGLEEEYAPSYYEETDLCMRIRAAGYRIVYSPSVEVMHFEFGSTASSKDAIALQVRNREIFCRRHAETLAAYHYPSTASQLKARDASAKVHFLVIDDRIPFVHFGSGFPRAAAIIRELCANGASVTFYPLQFPEADPAAARADFPAEVEFALNRGLNGLVKFLSERAGVYDAVIVSRPHNMRAFQSALDAGNLKEQYPYVIYDAEALFAEREALRRQLKGPKLSEFEAKLLRSDEVSLASNAKVIVTVSEREDAFFSTNQAAKRYILGHRMSAKSSTREFDQRKDLLFVGALEGSSDSSPNVDSLVWFVRQVMPILDGLAGSDYVLRVAGRIDSAEVTSLASDRIELLGIVPDLTELYAATRVFIAPTRFAAGIPHKVHEASANGLPAVTTHLIGSQLGWVNGVDILTADTPGEFAEACRTLYENSQLWNSIRTGALARLEDECSPEKFSVTVKALVDDVPRRDDVMLRRVQRAEGQPKKEGDARRVRRINELWSVDYHARAEAVGMSWLEHPLVTRRINLKVSGDPNVGIYEHLQAQLRRKGWLFPVKRALSLGCGQGGLERQLATMGIAKEITGYDLSSGAIERAKELALSGQLYQLCYEVMDLEHPNLDKDSADIIFAGHSLHHIENLERLCEQVRYALKPGGVFHLNEFVGATRFQWTEAQLSAINDFVSTLLPRHRLLPSGQERPPRSRPTILQVTDIDPSEAVRSADIIKVIEQYFDIEERVDYGGALLHLGLSDIAQNFSLNNQEDVQMLERFFALEDQLMGEGVVGSDFTVITAR
jgi:O-antigen biosynthesis protein